MFGWLANKLKIKKAPIKTIIESDRSPGVIKQLVDMYETGDMEYYRITLFTKQVAQVFVFYNLKENTFADGKTICYISDLSVHPIFRRKGIGSRMINHMKLLAKSKGFTKICLGVYKEKTELIRLYKKLGFTQERGCCDYNIVLRNQSGERVPQKEYMILQCDI